MQKFENKVIGCLYDTTTPDTVANPLICTISSPELDTDVTFVISKYKDLWLLYLRDPAGNMILECYREAYSMQKRILKAYGIELVLEDVTVYLATNEYMEGKAQADKAMKYSTIPTAISSIDQNIDKIQITYNDYCKIRDKIAVWYKIEK